MTAHTPIDEPLSTIVGPRSERAGGGRIVVPRGMERLLTLAGSSPEWREKVLAGPLNAADEAGIGLSASERAILGAVPRGALEQVAASFARRTVRTPLGRTAAGVAAAALLATGFGGQAEAGLPDDSVLRSGARSEVTMLVGIRPDGPNEMSAKAELIVLLKAAPFDAQGRSSAEVVRVLKGKRPAKNLVIDLNHAGSPEHAKAVKEMVAANGDGPVLLIVGRGEKGEEVGRLHLGGKWIGLDRGGEDGVWEVDTIYSHMEEVWAGGTDMLLRFLDVLTQFPDTHVPIACTCSWEDPVEAGRVEGRVRAAMAVDLAGRGGLALFVASEGGDRVFAFDPKAGKYGDITARLKLASRSSFAAWGDFGGSGRLDLASSDGKGLVIWAQAADGTFASTAVADVPKAACTGLAAVDVGQKGRAGLVWGSAGGAVLLVPAAGKPGAFVAKPLAAAAGAVKDAAGAGAPIVADFDGDGYADVVMPFAKGSVFHKGLGGGEFAEGAACEVALGEGRTGAFVGDFDMDGRLDVMTVAGDSPRLWQNAGGGRFRNEFGLCGELTYISKPGAVGGNACDINGDGRTDVFLFYADMCPQVFFNRGFRSFGHAHKPIDLEETGNLPEAAKGQQAGVMADFNGDGAQDMALVLADGTVRLVPQAVAADAPLVLRVALAPGASAGPVTVSARDRRMSLGAWAVQPGGEAFFGRVEAGEVTVTWQLPGEPPQNRAVLLDDRPVRLLIGGGK